MKFEDFAAKTGIGNTIVLWADESPSRRVRFSIGRSILIEQLGVRNPVRVDESIKRCEEQREMIEAACLRAFKRQPADFVTLMAADFENSAQGSPPQPPTDVAGG
jgi:hypothetical protein